MKNPILALQFLVVFFPSGNAAQGGSFSGSDYLDLDKKVKLSWDYAGDTIEFEYRVKTTGWIGVGFTPVGGMINADMVVGWVNGDEKHFSDRHSLTEETPIKDDELNYDLLDLREENGETIMKFKRLLDTCDIEQDYWIQTGTTIVIYAYNDEEPGLGEDLKHDNYHGPNRGSKPMAFLELQFTEFPNGPDDQYTDLLIQDHEISEETTEYFCTMFRAPQGPTKRHITASGPIITEGNENIVHHYVLYSCSYRPEDLPKFEEFFVKYPKGQDCFFGDLDTAFVFCNATLIGWAIGSQGLVYPDYAGAVIPPYDEKMPTFYRFEMHYDNQLNVKGRIDNSGARLYWTEKLREHDLALVTVTHIPDWTLIVPPQTDAMTVGHCSAKCTKVGIPPEGVKIMQSFLHGHTSTKSIKVRHWRDGKELPWIDYEPNYDFDFQRAKILDEPVLFLPGDQITVECISDTRDRNVTTLGGLGTDDEMCNAFIHYYPAGDVFLADCMSHSMFQDWYDFLEIPEVEISLLTYKFHLHLDPPVRYDEWLDNTRGWENTDMEAFREIARNNTQGGFCRNSKLDHLMPPQDPVGYPDIEVWEPPPRNCSRKS